ncbi:hypothetical protein F5883DRAFT_532095 [Diaporthe sp. PMI_573]|nr:hypothetical protein F5883DRAFT_532095 [Diaporthaceae sp. PMI_573]
MSSGRAYQARSIRLWEVPCTMGTDRTVLLVNTPWPCLQHFQPGSTRMLPMRSAKPRHAFVRGFLKLPWPFWPKSCDCGHDCCFLFWSIVYCLFLFVALALPLFCLVWPGRSNAETTSSVVSYVDCSSEVLPLEAVCLYPHGYLAGKHGRDIWYWGGVWMDGYGYEFGDQINTEVLLTHAHAHAHRHAHIDSTHPTHKGEGRKEVGW